MSLTKARIFHLGDVCEELTSGGAAPQGDKYFIDGKYPFIRVADMGRISSSEKFISYTKDTLNDVGIEKLREFPAGTVLFTKSGASLLLNQRAIIKQPSYVVSHIGCMIPKPDVSSDWLYYFMKQVDFAHYAHATTLPSLKLSTLKEIEIPVPPLSEQERIVARIEKLFSELDKAVETLQKTKQQLAVYRQAVLKEAFYRRRNAAFITQKVKDFAEVDTGATPLTSNKNYYNGTIAWITSASVNQDVIFAANDYITDLAIKETNCKVFVPNTIIVAMYGEGKTRGKCSILKINAATNQAVAAITIRNHSEVSYKYIKWFFTMNYYALRRKASGGVQPNLNLGIIKNYDVPIYDICTQNEIVTEIESKLSVCGNIEQAVDTTLQQAEAMRQSILKKAFEEELV